MKNIHDFVKLLKNSFKNNLTNVIMNTTSVYPIFQGNYFEKQYLLDA